jgi:hypothetical protein
MTTLRRSLPNRVRCGSRSAADLQCPKGGYSYPPIRKPRPPCVATTRHRKPDLYGLQVWQAIRPSSRSRGIWCRCGDQKPEFVHRKTTRQSKPSRAAHRESSKPGRRNEHYKGGCYHPLTVMRSSLLRATKQSVRLRLYAHGAYGGAAPPVLFAL